MGYIRRRVKNYTILILSIDEKSETIDRAAALRVRNGQEAGTFHLEREEGDPEKQQEDFDDFRDFLSNDLVMLTDYSAVRPVMDKWYQAGAGEFFTNTAMDMLPQIEEAVPKRNILYLLTLGGCFLWMFFDLYRMPLLVDEANERMAEKVYLGAPKFPVSGPSR